MTHIQHISDTIATLSDKTLTVVRSSDDSEVLLVMDGDLECAYVRVESDGLDMGSDHYCLTESEMLSTGSDEYLTESDKELITIAIDNFLENETTDETTDYTFDVRVEQGLFHYGY